MFDFFNDVFSESVFFGIVITLVAYWFGVCMQRKLKYSIVNPLLISSIIIIVVLAVSGISYKTYINGAKYISFLLTPATVCLAVPMYRQLLILKKNIVAVILGILSGSIAGAFSILILSLILNLSPDIYASLLPKSVTTAIALGISEELGGNTTITVCAVVITGVFGAVVSKVVCKIFKITEPVAVGLAMGNSSHAIGTAKAIELGEIEGAMSSLSIVVAGIITVVMANVMIKFSVLF